MAIAAFSAAISLLFLSISSPSVNGNFGTVVDCNAVVLNLAGCISFVTIGSKDDKPAGTCCTGLKKVLDTNPKCLCEGLKKSDGLGMKLNITKAETLPVLCKVNSPSVSSCSSVPITPASAPAAPSGGAKSTSAPAPSPSHGSSLIPTFGLSFVISGALVALFSRF